MDELLKFSNSYIELGEVFFQRVLPQKVVAPKLLLWNETLANSLFISEEQQKNKALLSQFFSGNDLPKGAEPIALAYSGHQFGHFNPQLGDGRAHLLGEVIDIEAIRRDIQLKGSGQTAFSRRGDGKCAIAPALREYIMSEALYALGVPTSRCLAVVSTGEMINRGIAKAGAVVTRVASSHIRVGTFQYFAARGNTDALKALLNYTIERHFPEIDNDEIEPPLTYENRILLFLEQAMNKQVTLIVEWLRIGFIHGVMNTDNTAICGETIDFGPCAMLGEYDEEAVFSSIDEYGRYAFGSQGKIAQWNMARLADCLLPLLIECNIGVESEEEKEQQAIQSLKVIIHQFTSTFDKAYYLMYVNKLGMMQVSVDNKTLVEQLLVKMKAQRLDYTQTFYHLTQSLTDHDIAKDLSETLGSWYESWLAMLKDLKIKKLDAKKMMTVSNPVVIPRNHHVEALLAHCEEALAVNMNSNHEQAKIFDIVDEFLTVLRSPYKLLNTTEKYQDIPGDNDRYYQTFCGT